MSSASVEKFQNEKKPKKKYQKFKANHEKNSASADKVSVPGLENDIVKKSSFEFVDLKDFPELKSSNQDTKTFSQNRPNNRRFKSNKSWLSVVTGGNESKLNTVFPSLSRSENLKKDVISLEIKHDIKEEPALDISAIVKETRKQENAIQKAKKSGSKTIPVQPQRNPNKKKRSDPVFINFQDILSTNKILKKRKEHNIVKNRAQRLRGKELLSGNFLDSSNPTRSRGKYREIKKKKLTNLKTSIIKERILKTKIKEQGVVTAFGSNCTNLFNEINFDAEIKIYLNDLNDKKLKKSESKKNKLNENLEINKEEKQENVKPEPIETLENVVSHVKMKPIPRRTAEGEIIYSAKFREYCNNIITPDLNSSVSKLIEELIKLQDRTFLRDPIKAKAKKRHVSGIREVKKYLKLKKVKMIIIAPNLEKLQMEGSVYDSINELKSMADSQSVPYVFALDRYKLGKCTKKNVPVSAFAVMNFEGLESLYENVLHQLMETKKKFAEMSKPNVAVKTEDVNSKVLSTLVSAFEDALHISKEPPPDED